MEYLVFTLILIYTYSLFRNRSTIITFMGSQYDSIVREPIQTKGLTGIFLGFFGFIGFVLMVPLIIMLSPLVSWMFKLKPAPEPFEDGLYTSIITRWIHGQEVVVEERDFIKGSGDCVAIRRFEYDEHVRVREVLYLNEVEEPTYTKQLIYNSFGQAYVEIYKVHLEDSEKIFQRHYLVFNLYGRAIEQFVEDEEGTKFHFFIHYDDQGRYSKGETTYLDPEMNLELECKRAQEIYYGMVN